MNLAVIGGRNFSDFELLSKEIDKLREKYTIEKIISGGAIGADMLGEMYALDHNIPTLIFEPDWSKGKGAGIMRNKDIIDASNYVIAFWDGESKGTLNSIKRARSSHKPLIIVRY